MFAFETEIGTDLAKAKQLLQTGELIGMPTETVYGLAGNALDAETVLKIFEVKSRPHFDPLIVHTYSIDLIKDYVAEIPPKASALIEKFMPGPLTILLKKKPIIPDLVTSGLDTVAIRIPNHPLTLQLLRSLSFPLAAPSANPFGYISPTTAQHVFNQLNSKIPYVLNGGPADIGLESTIIGFENDEPVIYRPGGLAPEEIERVIGKAAIVNQSSSKPLSPGMLSSHYAPRTPLKFGKAEFIIQQLGAAKGKHFSVICFDRYLVGVDKGKQILLSARGDLHEAAKNLFAVLRQLDSGETDMILAIEFPAHGLGIAINDRLKRASG